MMGAAMLKRHQFVQSLWALYRLVVSSITWGSQAQPLFLFITQRELLLFCVLIDHNFCLYFYDCIVYCIVNCCTICKEISAQNEHVY